MPMLYGSWTRVVHAFSTSEAMNSLQKWIAAFLQRPRAQARGRL